MFSLLLPLLPWLGLCSLFLSGYCCCPHRLATFRSASWMDSGLSLWTCLYFPFSICIYMPTLHTDQVFQPEISFYRAVFKTPQCEPDSTSVLLTVPACISPPLNLFLTSLAFAHGDPNSSHFISLAFSAHLPGRNFFSCESWHHLTGPEWVA